jgi:hypothetical protein
VPRHVARHVARLIVDYFAYVSTTSPHAAHRRLLRLRHAPGHTISLLDFSSVDCTGSRHAPRHSVSRLNYSVHGCHDFVLRPHWLYFSHVVHRDCFSRGNAGSISSTLRTGATSSSGRIASTTHLD